VPRDCAFRAVTVKGYVDRVEVVDSGRIVARHTRCYDRNEQILEPLHYLSTLDRKPAALDHAPVLRNWQLPEAFAQLRLAMEKQHGPTNGRRHYIRVLQLLADRSVEVVEQAVVIAIRSGKLSAEQIAAHVAHQARAGGGQETPSSDSVATSLCQYQVPRPDLSRFNQLLTEGNECHD
jgi:hypothetical protein